MPSLEVKIDTRIPFRTKARMKVGWLTARLGLLTVTSRLVRRLAFDYRIGRGKWTRRWVETEMTWH